MNSAVAAAAAAAAAAHADHQAATNHLGSYHPQMQMNQMQGPVMNGVSGMPHTMQPNQMVGQQQGMQQQVDSSANLMQQQHNFEVSDLLCSFFCTIDNYFQHIII